MARLLVVDDEADVRDLIVRRVRDEGHEVLAAGTAEAALAEVARHGLPDAAVLDVDLPGMDGVELLDRLREQRPGLPAIFVTVLWSGGVSARIRASGGYRLAKPFTVDGLRAALRQILPGAASAEVSGDGR